MTPSEPLYRLIPLTQGQWAVVDAADYDWLMQWKWQAQWNRAAGYYYATRQEWIGNGKRQHVGMHRQILGLKQGDERQGHHKSHNTLDNRRGNLDVVSQAENKKSKRRYVSNLTGHKGVDEKKGRYRVRIQSGGKFINLGSFPLTIEGLQVASEVYQRASDRLFGEFSFLEPGQKKRPYKCYDDGRLNKLVQALKAEGRRSHPRVRKDSNSGHTGVSIQGNAYTVRTRIEGRLVHLGSFPFNPKGLKQAIKVHQKAVTRYLKSLRD